jgi:hypothetical protein
MYQKPVPFRIPDDANPPQLAPQSHVTEGPFCIPQKANPHQAPFTSNIVQAQQSATEPTVMELAELPSTTPKFRIPKRAHGKLTITSLYPLLYSILGLPVPETTIPTPTPAPSLPIGIKGFTEPTAMLLAELPSTTPTFRIPKRAHGKLTII